MVAIEVTHFSAVILFAVFASIVFAITQKKTRDDMVRYGLKCFVYFLGGVILAGWVMYLLRR
jgi:hypothetical protein